MADGIVVAVIGRLWLKMRRARWQESSRRSSFLDLLFRDGVQRITAVVFVGAG